MTHPSFFLKYRAMTLAFLFLALSAIAPSLSIGENTLETFFPDTDYELNVYHIKGKLPGKTLLIIGGIQGDEPGGFLSADLYADMKLVAGNLIVVPRANFYSIILNRRQVNEDMNRKFSGSSDENYEAQVVSILKRLISESDCLLNLHDGSGFYRDSWESEMKNPGRYGQSIIVDSDEYIHPDTGKKINLGEMARLAISGINAQVDDPENFFRLNNHRTRAPDSLHPEQRKSATYYALYDCGIPAFGIETSKSLPLETRIYHHNLAVNFFMEIFGVTPEIPGIGLCPPQIKYAVVKINNASPIVVANGETLHISRGDSIKIIHIEGNYSRGLSADIEGYGSVNDTNKSFTLKKATRVLIKKDHLLCGEFDIVLSDSPLSNYEITAKSTVLAFRVKVNGREGFYPNGSHVDIVKGDLLELMDPVTTPESIKGLTCNFKGFVGSNMDNTGEDRGYIINTAKELWDRYSLYKKGRVYQVIASKDDDEIIGRLFFDIHPPLFEYMLLYINEREKRWVSDNESINLKVSDSIRVVDIKSNVVSEDIGISIMGKGGHKSIGLGDSISGSGIVSLFGGASTGCGIHIERGKILLAFLPVTIIDCDQPSDGENTDSGK